MSIDHEITALSSLAPLRIERKSDSVAVSLDKTNIHDMQLILAFEKAKADKENYSELGVSPGVYRKLKPEVLEAFKDMCKPLTAEARTFAQAIGDLFEMAAGQDKIVRMAHEVTVDYSVITEYRYFKYDSERGGFFKTEPQDFKR